MSLETRDGYPRLVQVGSLYVNRDFFIQICSMGSLLPDQAAEIWDDCMYDVYVHRISQRAARLLIENTLRITLGHQFHSFWTMLEHDNHACAGAVRELKIMKGEREYGTRHA